MNEYRDKFQFPYIGLLPLFVIAIDMFWLSKEGELFSQENAYSLWIDGFLTVAILFLFTMNIMGFDYFVISKDDITIYRIIRKQRFSLTEYKNFRIRKQGLMRWIVANNCSSGKIKLILPQYRTPVKLEYLLERLTKEDHHL